MATLTKKKIQEINAKINKLKRMGWNLDKDTIVMRINDKNVTYSTFKKLLKSQ